MRGSFISIFDYNSRPSFYFPSASALMRLEKEAFAKPVGGDGCKVTEKVSNIENSVLIHCDRNTN
jgi:hypothetical protein